MLRSADEPHLLSSSPVSGATESTTTMSLGSGYGYHDYLMLTDPDTASAWTKTGVDALEALIEVA